jgi:hypothetical protein
MIYSFQESEILMALARVLLGLFLGMVWSILEQKQGRRARVI